MGDIDIVSFSAVFVFSKRKLLHSIYEIPLIQIAFQDILDVSLLNIMLRKYGLLSVGLF